VVPRIHAARCTKRLKRRTSALALAICLVFLMGVALVLTGFEAEEVNESSTGLSAVDEKGAQAGTAKVTNAACAAKLPPGSRFLP
jgi:hypothetical protein